MGAASPRTKSPAKGSTTSALSAPAAPGLTKNDSVEPSVYLGQLADVLMDPQYRVKLKLKNNPEMVQLAPIMAEQVALRLREIATKLKR